MNARLTPSEIERLCAASVPARAEPATAAGGGGRRRRRGPRSARPRLSRRERRSVNDALLRAEPVADEKAEFDVRARAATPFCALRDAPRDVLRAATAPRDPRRHADTAPRPGRHVRALVKAKGARVRPVLRAIEDVVRAVRPGERVALRLGDSLSRFLAHCVAQFYGFMHRSEGVGQDRVLYVASPSTPRKLPPVRLVDILA